MYSVGGIEANPRFVSLNVSGMARSNETSHATISEIYGAGEGGVGMIEMY